MTRTYAILKVEQSTFDDIVEKLTAALKDDRDGPSRYQLQDGNIALEGIALSPIEGNAKRVIDGLKDVLDGNVEVRWNFKYHRDNVIAQEGDETEPLRVLKATSVEGDVGFLHGYVVMRNDGEILWVDETRAVDYTRID